MIESNKILDAFCKHNNCFDRGIYEFTDAKMEVKIVDENGASATSVETIIIGHACELHFEEVEQMLKEIYGDEEKV